MLSRFSTRNIKSIGEDGVTLELKPLTILVGPNSSGKSSILQALAIIYQSLGQKDLRYGGELIQFSSIVDLIHKNDIHKWLSFELILKGSFEGLRYEFRYDSEECKQTVIKNQKDFLSIELIGNRKEGLEFIARLHDGRAQSRGKESWSLGILDSHLFNKEYWKEKWPELEEAEKIGNLINEKIKKKICFISSSRGDIPFVASAEKVPTGYFWVGSRGENLIPILTLLSSPLYDKELFKIIKWSEKFNLFKLSAGARAPNILRAEYKDKILDTPLNLALASAGSRQVLSIIVQIFGGPEKSLIMIEEPEISLHPKQQITVLELFAEAIRENGQQIIITSHSHFILLGLGILVKNKLLKADDIAVYEITKDKKGTKKQIVNLSENGFLMGWPSSFDKIEKKIAAEWFKSFEK